MSRGRKTRNTRTKEQQKATSPQIKRDDDKVPIDQTKNAAEIHESTEEKQIDEAGNRGPLAHNIRSMESHHDQNLDIPVTSKQLTPDVFVNLIRKALIDSRTKQTMGDIWEPMISDLKTKLNEEIQDMKQEHKRQNIRMNILETKLTTLEEEKTLLHEKIARMGDSAVKQKSTQEDSDCQISMINCAPNEKTNNLEKLTNIEKRKGSVHPEITSQNDIFVKQNETKEGKSNTCGKLKKNHMPHEGTNFVKTENVTQQKETREDDMNKCEKRTRKQTTHERNNFEKTVEKEAVTKHKEMIENNMNNCDKQPKNQMTDEITNKSEQHNLMDSTNKTAKSDEDNTLHGMIDNNRRYVEDDDRERRKNNIIITGLNEDTPLTINGTEFKSDKQKINTILEIINCRHVTVTEIKRLGERRGQIRPLRIILRTTQQKYDILAQSRQLKRATEQFARIYLNMDLNLQALREQRKRHSKIDTEQTKTNKHDQLRTLSEQHERTSCALQSS